MKNTVRKVFSLLSVHRAYIFPGLCALLLVILSSLSIHGSSIGIYHQIFYGPEKPDSNLLLNKPLSIRSDEWIVNTQKAVAQAENGFKPLNQNQGNGENVRLLSDAPNADWSTIFKPHNYAFFVVPFENAFAFRWWFMALIVLISAYVFALALLPKQYLKASLIAVILFCSPFIHWWYTHGATATIAYTLFGLTLALLLIRSESKRHILLYGAGLAYIGVAFAFILYPPFQIPAALVAVAFLVGEVINKRKTIKLTRFKITTVAVATLLIAVASSVFILQNLDTVQAVTHSAYPGARKVVSGGYNLIYLLSSHLTPLLQLNSRWPNIAFPSIGATNQSELSNFILAPLLLIPSLIYLTIRTARRAARIDYRIVFMVATLLLFLVWMFVPNLSLVGTLTMLDKVPHQRLLVGFGLIGIISLTLFLSVSSKLEYRLSNRGLWIVFASLIILSLCINFYISHAFPSFIGYKLAVLFALPLPVFWLLMHTRYQLLGLMLLALFSFCAVARTNPLYHGLDVIIDDPLISAIQETPSGPQDRWVSDFTPIENFVAMAGKHSLTGVYTYPQKGIWNELHVQGEEYKYNRYAHVGFTFDREDGLSAKPTINQATADQFNVYIEPCDPFFDRTGVKFFITTTMFTRQQASCLRQIKQVTYPKVTMYLYEKQ